jgi:hypothetical protein
VLATGNPSNIRIRRIELTIQIDMVGGVRSSWFIRRGYDALFPMALINRFRSRATRDISVPIGTPVTSAISG